MTDDDMERLAQGLAEIAAGLPRRGKPSKAVVETLADLLNVVTQCKALEARVATLEQRPELKHGGVWREGTQYREATLVSHAGGLWLAKRTTSTRPGQSDEWQLVVKSGHAAGANGAEPRHVRTAIRPPASYERPT